MDCQQPNNLNDFPSNLVKFNLYIDHQQLAPLIRQLEDTLSQAENQTNNQFSRLELREIIYQEFVTIVNTLYGERFKEIKLEEQLPPIPQQEQQLHQRLLLRPREQKHNRGNEVDEAKQPFGRNTVKTRAVYSLQVEIELIQWIITCNKNTFEHKQIVEKYCEISKGTKKRLSIDNIMGLLEKYKLKHIIVRGRQGKEHYFRQQINKEPSIVIKEEEFSKIINNNDGLSENAQPTDQTVKKDEQASSSQIQSKSASRHQEDPQSEEYQQETASGQESKGKIDHI